MRRAALIILDLVFVLVHLQATDRSSLQARIESAQPGDTIRVSSGTYPGDITVNKRLVLIGIGRPILQGDHSGSVITVVADSCVIAGFRVEGSGHMLVHEDAGILVKSSGNTVKDNILGDILFGIYLFGSHDNRIEHNEIVGRAELDLGTRGSGIHIWNSHHNIVLGNSIREMRDGMYIQNANHTIVRDNLVTDLRYGLHYMYADSNEFTGNRFENNVAGAAIMYSTGIRMRRNTFMHNRGFASYGILFQDCHAMIADSNVVADNVVGMFFEASTQNVFRHNVIAQNDVALQMFQNATGNTFTENNFIDNLNPISVVGRTTGTRWSADGRGNYWSSYDGYDLDGDGIGDVPMKIENPFDYIEGHAPAARVMLYSPAAQALSAAVRSFPVFALTAEVDDRPLLRPVTTPTAHGPSGRTRHAGMTAGFLAVTLQGFLIAALGWWIGHFRRKGMS